MQLPINNCHIRANVIYRQPERRTVHGFQRWRHFALVAANGRAMTLKSACGWRKPGWAIWYWRPPDAAENRAGAPDRPAPHALARGQTGNEPPRGYPRRAKKIR